MAKRNYQDVIFTGYDLTTVTYIEEDLTSTPPIKKRVANVYMPKGDTETKRACVVGLYGGGGDINDLERWAKGFTSRGYPFFVPDYKDVVGGFTEEEQLKSIAFTKCFYRYLHSKKGFFGINGGKILGMGVSAGGLTQWQTNVAINFGDDVMFDNPVNELYKKAKQDILGTASMPGSCNKSIQRKIIAGIVPHKDYHGTKDIMQGFSIAEAKEAMANMVLVNRLCSLHEFTDVGHALEGKHDVIMLDVVKYFATLLGITIVPETPVT